jgi:hypothetical protein
MLHLLSWLYHLTRFILWLCVGSNGDIILHVDLAVENISWVGLPVEITFLGIISLAEKWLFLEVMKTFCYRLRTAAGTEFSRKPSAPQA